MTKKQSYDSSAMSILKDIEAVRTRPHMYIGSLHEDGVLNCVREIIDNAVDECLAGHADKVEVYMSPDTGSVTVTDNGRGIPTGYNEKHKKTGVQIAAENLHGGGKFDKQAYAVSGGLNGVGLSVVNFLSEHMAITVVQNGESHRYDYEKGQLASLPAVNKANPMETSTEVDFTLDKTMFQCSTVPPRDVLEEMLFERSCLVDKTTFELDDPDGRFVSWRHENGMAAWLKQRGKLKTFPHPPVLAEAEGDGWGARAAFVFVPGQVDPIEGAFCNAIRNTEGGSHLSGFRRGVSRGFSKFMAGSGAAMLKKRDESLKITAEDVLEGCVAMVSVWHTAPEFVGNKKAALGNREIVSPLSDAVAEEFLRFLEEQRSGAAKAILAKTLAAAKSREAARKSRELSKRLEDDVLGLGAASKLAGCESRDPAERELIIVEGDSAGGSAKNARDTRFQAVFPLRGKILNTNSKTTVKALDNKEIRDLVGVLGCGAGKKFDPDALAYHKIIVSPDADHDGQHIGSLVATLFLRHFPELIRRGHLYYALPPLYIVKTGKKVVYCRDEEALRDLRAKRVLDKYAILVRRGDEGAGDEKEASADEARRFTDMLRRWHAVAEDFERTTGLPAVHLRFLQTTTWMDRDPRVPVTLAEFVPILERFETKVDKRAGLVEYNRNGRKWQLPLMDLADTANALNEVEAQGAIENAGWVALLRRSDRGELLGGAEGDFAAMCKAVAEAATKGMETTYLKGLGEMDPDEFRQTTIGVDSRRLARVTMRDAEEADRVCSMLMGGAASGMEDRKRLMLETAEAA